MTIATKISTWMTGQYVGKDRFGNRYFQSRLQSGRGKRRRWVLYQGIPEASKVPPEWFGWLHYTEESPLRSEPTAHLIAVMERNEAKPGASLKYQPNFSGTKRAWRPSGSLLATGKRPASTGDYEAWHPSDSLILERKKRGT